MKLWWISTLLILLLVDYTTSVHKEDDKSPSSHASDDDGDKLPSGLLTDAVHQVTPVRSRLKRNLWDIFRHPIRAVTRSIRDLHDGADKLLGADEMLSFSTQKGKLLPWLNRDLVSEAEYVGTTVDLWFEVYGKSHVWFDVYAMKPTRKKKFASKKPLKRVKLKGKKRRKSGKISLPMKGYRIMVRVRNMEKFRSARYKVTMRRPNQGKIWKPDKRLSNVEASPVCGFAEVHLHQFASMAFTGGFFKNSYEGPLPKDRRNVPWVVPPTRWQQVHESFLKKAHQDGMNLIVVTFVSNEMGCYALLPVFRKFSDFGKTNPCPDMPNILRQMSAAHKFAERNSEWYEIALDPWHAQRIIHSGKSAIVLSLEASNLFNPRYGRWEDQFDELYSLGLRTLHFAHETDSRFAGAAPHAWVFKFQQTWVTGRPFELDKRGKNRLGVKPRGYQLLKRMMKRNMVIDMSHLSQHASNDVGSVLEKASKERSHPYPAFDSHCRFKELMASNEDVEVQGEFVCTRKKWELIRRLGGIIGIRNGPEHTKDFVPKDGSQLRQIPNDCDGSSTTIAQYVQFAAEHDIQVALGSDLNGWAGENTPRFGPNACANPRGKSEKKRERRRRRQVKEQLRKNKRLHREYDTKSVNTVAAEGDLIRDMALLGANVTSLQHSAHNFIRMWLRAYDEDEFVATHTVDDSHDRMVCASDNYIPKLSLEHEVKDELEKGDTTSQQPVRLNPSMEKDFVEGD